MGVESGLLTRDFMLPWPSRDLASFARRVVDYPIASALSQALFVELKTEVDDRVQKLLFPSVGLLWTEHSERATVRTWAQAARVPEDVRRMIGRWRPSVDESYERNLKANVTRCQAVIAHFIKKNLGNMDPFDEVIVI